MGSRAWVGGPNGIGARTRVLVGLLALLGVLVVAPAALASGTWSFTSSDRMHVSINWATDNGQSSQYEVFTLTQPVASATCSSGATAQIGQPDGNPDQFECHGTPSGTDTATTTAPMAYTDQFLNKDSFDGFSYTAQVNITPANPDVAVNTGFIGAFDSVLEIYIRASGLGYGQLVDATAFGKLTSGTPPVMGTVTFTFSGCGVGSSVVGPQSLPSDSFFTSGGCVVRGNPFSDTPSIVPNDATPGDNTGATDSLAVSNAPSTAIGKANGQGASGAAKPGTPPTKASRAASPTSGDALAKVEIAVRQLGKDCAWLQNLQGQFKHSQPQGGKCTTPILLPATGTSSWHVRYTKPLPPGHYTIYVVAVDRAGATTFKLTPHDRVTFTVG